MAIEKKNGCCAQTLKCVIITSGSFHLFVLWSMVCGAGHPHVHSLLSPTLTVVSDTCSYHEAILSSMLSLVLPNPLSLQLSCSHDVVWSAKTWDVF